ncbi:unnamed protein product [Fusarium graminearum]|uniref:Uncharacterized protein n=1 Tax=Gibberella zeae TaxID=5518 RepID=A0A4E9E7A0_GIBZA|nr:unnamed protein product [Fusarium graminearum]
MPGQFSQWVIVRDQVHYSPVDLWGNFRSRGERNYKTYRYGHVTPNAEKNDKDKEKRRDQGGKQATPDSCYSADCPPGGYFSTKLSPPFGFSLQFVSGLVFPSLPQISFTFSSPKFPPNKILLFLPLGIRGRLGPPLDRVYCNVWAFIPRAASLLATITTTRRL